MSDDGWGDDDGWTDGAGDATAAPAAGDEAEEVEEEKPRGGGGDGKCRNCRQVIGEFFCLGPCMSRHFGRIYLEITPSSSFRP